MEKQWGDYKVFHLSAGPLEAIISNLGATLISLQCPDRKGQQADVVLGYSTPEEYLAGECFLGAIVGPWANRIADGRFKLNGEIVQLDQNENGNHLHGGSAALHHRKWDVMSADEQSVMLTTRVTKGTAGYPANIDIRVTYQLSSLGLSIEYHVESDQLCPINMTAHPYFNLAGSGHTIDDHVLSINGAQFLATNDKAIPTEVLDVANTPFDLRSPRCIGEALRGDHPQLEHLQGFDHCWVLAGDETFRHVATLLEPDCGRQMEVWTDQPGLQFYTGQYLPGEKGKDDVAMHPRAGLCLETECFPDQVNQSNAAACLLSPQQIYRHHTEYRFAVDGE